MNIRNLLKRPLLLTLALIFTFFYGASPVMANILGKSELTGTWKERFQNVKKLNEYTQKGLKADIADAIIKKYDLSGANFVGGSFNNSDWNETTGNKLTFTNTVFRGNKFTNTRFENSTFTNVTFEDSEFENTSFFRSTLIGVKFVRCKFFDKMSFQQLKNSTIEFDHAALENVNFTGTHATMSFNNSTLNDVELTSLAFPSNLIFEHTKLNSVDLSRSKISKMTLVNTTGFIASNGSTIAEVEVRDSDIGIGLNQGSVGKASFTNCIVDAEFQHAKLKEIQIINCKDMKEFGLYQTTVDILHISNCPIKKFEPLEAIIQNFNIEKSSIVNSDFGDMKAKNLTLTNVSFDQKVDFTGAQVEHLTTKNVTKLPGLNLNLTGSNVKF